MPTGGGIDAAGGATLHYDTTAGSINQLPTTFTGYGTLLVHGGNSLIFGGECGDLNVNFSPGAIIDVEAGTLWELTRQQQHGRVARFVQCGNLLATFDGGDGVIYIDALSGDGTFQGGGGGARHRDDRRGRQLTSSGALFRTTAMRWRWRKWASSATLAGANTFTGGAGDVFNGTLEAQTTAHCPATQSRRGFRGERCNLGGRGWRKRRVAIDRH